VRAVFMVLLSANLLFLAWARWIDGPRDVGAQDSLSRLPRLQLVSESPPGSKPTSANVHLATAPLASVASPVADSTAMAERTSLRVVEPARSCTSVGPFNDIASAARAAGLLTQRGFQLQQRAEEGDAIEGYWVFVGGMQSDEDVAQVVNRLEKSGFADAHIMKNYSTNRRVSLGMFSTRERAEKRAAAVRNMGLLPEVGERKFPGTIYWVDVVLKRGPGSKQQLPVYLFADIGHAKVEMQPCPAALRPVEPGVPQLSPGDEDDVIRELPRTTVASAPPLH
jgi:hypothetical protein